jgi:hypothetical protein
MDKNRIVIVKVLVISETLRGGGSTETQQKKGKRLTTNCWNDS